MVTYQQDNLLVRHQTTVRTGLTPLGSRRLW